MRLAILSDVHANLEALRAVLDDVAVQSADRILCLGDVVGYNADPAACLDLLRRAGALTVAGNHDRAVAGTGPAEAFPPAARRAVDWTRARLDSDALAWLAALPMQAVLPDEVRSGEAEAGLLVAVHGTLLAGGGCDRTYVDSDERRRQCLANLRAHPSGARLCAVGHTHRLEVTAHQDGRLTPLMEDRIALRADADHLVNPGTVGQPRTADRRATYLLLDVSRRVLTVRRLAYDFAAPRAKARAAGLLPSPADALREMARETARRALRRVRAVGGMA